MKGIILLTFCLFAVFAFACAGNNSPHKHSANSQNTEKQIYRAVGVVKKIDPENGKITIDHEDIPGFMSAMEMTEAVSDKKMLEAVKAGNKVEFELERTGSDLLITELTKIGEVALIKAAEIYKTNCAECHGERGEGAKKGISFLKGHALHHSEAEFIKQVEKGEGKKMPAFKDKLSSEEIAAVVKFVREDLQKGKITEETHKH